MIYRDPVWDFDGDDLDSVILEEDAARYLEQHPDAWRLFCRYAHQLIDGGASKCSAKAIVERIRWDHITSAHGVEKPYAWDNTLTSSIARAFVRAYPEHAHRFEFRPRKRVAA